MENKDINTKEVLETEKQPEKRPELRKVKKDKIEALISSEKATNRKLVKAVAFLSVILVMFACVCNSFSVRDRARTRLENMQDDYVFSQQRTSARSMAACCRCGDYDNGWILYLSHLWIPCVAGLHPYFRGASVYRVLPL